MPTGWVSKINPCKCQVFTTATTASYTSAEKYTLTARSVGISHAVILASQMAPDRIVAIRLARTADLGTIKQLCEVATAGMLFCPGSAGGMELAHFVLFGHCVWCETHLCSMSVTTVKVEHPNPNFFCPGLLNSQPFVCDLAAFEAREFTLLVLFH